MIWKRLVFWGTGGMVGMSMYTEYILPFLRHREIRNNIRATHKKIEDDDDGNTK